MMPSIVRHITRAAAERALDRQQLDGFSVEVGAQQHTDGLGRYFVTRPHRGTWVLHSRSATYPVVYGTVRQVLDRVFGGAR